uniref:Proteasome subunit beta n=1 Tax=Arcella intermedia TaxID=1963864 RepID=A0A6B2LGY9_9EUKA|eukprot:TRINITY_DN1291_c0_g1_i1.p1 TRINITY_DN1291_c0_g1~~TRINITY_DN1291_c0_g1_i1.p1  ORF type:complete len:233 (-),score=50.78 TRINITY_DN1291_c0_g1_i1:76-774(-)
MEVYKYQFEAAPTQAAKEHAWSPYVDNGGTTLAIAGKDFCVLASDTRLSSGYSIHTRTASKITALTDKCVISTSGMQADQRTLHKLLESRMVSYKQTHRKTMSTTAVAQMLSNTLYYKRFFPYYTFNVLGGIDENGVGCVFSYDAVGSFERTQYSSSGSGQGLIQPFLDSQVAKKNQTGVKFADLTEEEVVQFVKDTMMSAGERDIYTGDFVDIAIVNKDGIRWEKFNLKFD